MIIEAVPCMPGFTYGRDALGVAHLEIRLFLFRVLFMPGSAIAHMRKMDRTLRNARARLAPPPVRGI